MRSLSHNFDEHANISGEHQHVFRVSAMPASWLFALLAPLWVVAYTNPLGHGCAPLPLAFTATDIVPTDTVTCTPFYLDEETPNLHDPELERCFEQTLGLRRGGAYRMDDRVLPGKAQHLADIHLLRQLRIHPARVHDPSQAVVHFTGLLPKVSYVFNTRLRGDAAINESCHGIQEHTRAMSAAASALETKMNSLPSSDPRVYVIVASDWNVKGDFGEALFNLLAKPIGRRRMLFGGSDLAFAAPYRLLTNARWFEEELRSRDLRPNFFTCVVTWPALPNTHGCMAAPAPWHGRVAERSLPTVEARVAHCVDLLSWLIVALPPMCAPAFHTSLRMPWTRPPGTLTRPATPREGRIGDLPSERLLTQSIPT